MGVTRWLAGTCSGSLRYVCWLGSGAVVETSMTVAVCCTAGSTRRLSCSRKRGEETGAVCERSVRALASFRSLRPPRLSRLSRPPRSLRSRPPRPSCLSFRPRSSREPRPPRAPERASLPESATGPRGRSVSPGRTKPPSQPAATKSDLGAAAGVASAAGRTDVSPPGRYFDKLSPGRIIGSILAASSGSTPYGSGSWVSSANSTLYRFAEGAKPRGAREAGGAAFAAEASNAGPFWPPGCTSRPPRLRPRSLRPRRPPRSLRSPRGLRSFGPAAGFTGCSAEASRSRRDSSGSGYESYTGPIAGCSTASFWASGTAPPPTGRPPRRPRRPRQRRLPSAPGAPSPRFSVSTGAGVARIAGSFRSCSGDRRVSPALFPLRSACCMRPSRSLRGRRSRPPPRLPSARVPSARLPPEPPRGASSPAIASLNSSASVGSAERVSDGRTSREPRSSRPSRPLRLPRFSLRSRPSRRPSLRLLSDRLPSAPAACRG